MDFRALGNDIDGFKADAEASDFVGFLRFISIADARYVFDIGGQKIAAVMLEHNLAFINLERQRVSRPRPQRSAEARKQSAQDRRTC
jgi:hypothetical protein